MNKIITTLLWSVVGIVLLWAVTKYQEHCERRQLQLRRKQVMTLSRSIPLEETIFVSIPSYRDPECVETIFDLFQQAASPRRIFIGLVQQNHELDGDTLLHYEKLALKHGIANFRDQIRCYSIPYTRAQGPMYARTLIQKHLYRGEQYWLSIDSHMEFGKHWDVKLVRYLAQCPNTSKPILTCYPPNFTSRRRQWWTEWSDTDTKPSFLRFRRFHPDFHVPEFEGPSFVRLPPPARPYPSIGWAAGCSFSFGSLIDQVPYTDEFPYLFFGEEYLMAARFYTHGWDLFTFPRVVVRHKWSRANRATFWELKPPGRVEEEKESYRKWHALFSGSMSSHLFGQVRSLQGFYQMCGIHMDTKQVNPKARLGLQTLEPTPEDEILCKYGSMTSYYMAKNSLDEIKR